MAIQAADLVQQFLAMVKISSPSRREGKLAAYLQAELIKLGFDVHVDDAGKAVGGDTGNIIATLAGTRQTDPIMFCCHMDTVEPCEGVNPIVEGDVVRSDGTTILGGDDKGGIAAILAAIREIKASNAPRGPIELVFTICEEVGMYGSKNLDFERIHAKQAYILDADGDIGTIVVQGPAKDVIKASLKGRPAHAGLAPERGVSAIQIAARAINNMKLLRIDADTTANIGTIAGGQATNIVAEQAEVIAESRSLYNDKLDAQSKHMKQCFVEAAQSLGGEAQVDIQRSYPAFTLAEDHAAIIRCKKAMGNLGLKPVTVSTGGGSDCNIFNGHGIVAIDLAVGMTDMHSKNESIKISDLVKAAELVAEIIRLG